MVGALLAGLWWLPLKHSSLAAAAVISTGVCLSRWSERLFRGAAGTKPLPEADVLNRHAMDAPPLESGRHAELPGQGDIAAR